MKIDTENSKILNFFGNMALICTFFTPLWQQETCFVFKNPKNATFSLWERLREPKYSNKGMQISINSSFLPHYFACSVNKSFCTISTNLAIKGINFDQNSEKISHLGFKMCIKAPKYSGKFISWQLPYFCFLHTNTYEWTVLWP